MNIRLILAIVGYLIRVEGALFLLPFLVALLYGEMKSAAVFACCAAFLVLFSFLLTRARERDGNKRIQMKEGYVIAALGWVVISLGGALPFFIRGAIPSFVDAFFESASGFTTTGASILNDIEALDKSMLFWRSFTHWVGGMGVLVFLLGLLPKLDASGVQLMKAESPGVMPGKLVPKLADSSRILYGIYAAMTVLCFLCLIMAGMPAFDSIIHAMGTAGTGGFSMKNASIGAYNSLPVEMVLAVFMLLFGVNFNVYYLLVNRRFKEAAGNEEWKVYVGVVAATVVLITANLMSQSGSGFGQSLRNAFFNVSTVITTTGYGTVDFNLWPTFSKCLLVLLMLIGACGGSTGGGMKVSRAMILVRLAGREISRILHPNQVKGIRSDGQTLADPVLRQVLVFFFLYLFLIITGTLVCSLDGFSFETTLTAVISAISNIGPGLGAVGPAGNFAAFSPLSKVVLSLIMITGRLEIFPMLVMLQPAAWKRG